MRSLCYYLFALNALACVSTEGTLLLTLQRYQNDTCNKNEASSCDYWFDISVQHLVLRGYDSLTHTYQHPVFTVKDKNGLIKFSDTLDTSPNPISIRYISGLVNLIFSVNDSLDRIFHESILLDPGEMSPGATEQFYHDYTTGILAFNTELTCLPHFTGVGCAECDDGWFGSRCDMGCQSNHTCHDVTGTDCVSCVPNYLGDAYNTTCVNATMSTCCAAQNSTCSECAAPRYTCSDTGEKVCGKQWAGTNCEQCQDNWFGKYCQVFCNVSSTRYTCSNVGDKTCVGNWVGQQCDSCKPDYYGINCEQNCVEDDYWTCDKRSGEKRCKGNRTGESCSECIEEDHYPIPGSAKCRRCVETSNYTCSNQGTKICKQDRYGSNCDILCVENERYVCLRDGRIKCKPNFRGPKWKCRECADDLYGRYCNITCYPSTFSNCHPHTGEVLCTTNYYNPPNCRKYCNTSSTLYSCNNNGDKTCLNVRRNATTDCTTCNEGWYGTDCAVHCKADKLRTECANNGTLLCVEGWDWDEEEECARCAPNYFGYTCSGAAPTCNMTCDTYCEDLINYKCDDEGVLVMTSEFEERVYSDYSETGDILIKSLCVVGPFSLCLVLATLLYKVISF